MTNTERSVAVAAIEKELLAHQLKVAALETALSVLTDREVPVPVVAERAAPVSHNRRTTEESVWEIVPEDRSVTISWVARRATCTHTAAQCHLSRLASKGLVVRTGRGRYTRGGV